MAGLVPAAGQVGPGAGGGEGGGHAGGQGQIGHALPVGPAGHGPGPAADGPAAPNNGPFPGLALCPYGTADKWAGADAAGSTYQQAVAAHPPGGLTKRLYFAHKPNSFHSRRACGTFVPKNVFHVVCPTRQAEGVAVTG